MPVEPIASHVCNRFKGLTSNRGTWESHWQEVADYVFPNHAKFEGSDAVGEKRTSKVYDSTPIHAAEMLAAGLHGRMTNPAQRWFEFRYSDKELAKDYDAKIWLAEAQQVQYDEMTNAKSGFSTHIHEMYLEHTVFGNGSLFIGEPKSKDGVLYKAISLSHGYWDVNEDGIVDTYYRRIMMTVLTTVSKFGLENCSEKVQKKYKAEKYGDAVNVIHAVEPRSISKTKGKRGVKDKKFISVYIEEATKTLLSDSGFDSFPYATPRYYVAAGEIYARGPAITALPDIKMLNKMMKTTLIAAEKAVDPPLNVPSDTYIKPIRTVPGGVNIYNAGSKDRAEYLMTGGHVPLGLEFMEELRQRIRQIFFNDQLELGHRPEMTATEVVQRTEDMLRLMGPILGRMQNEGLDIVINRTFDILLKQGKFGPPPAIVEERGANIEIIYTSPIARAQRQLEVGGFQRLLEVITPIANLDEEQRFLKRLDFDEILEVFSELLGVRPSIIKPTDQVESEEQDQQEANQLTAGVQNIETASKAGLNIAKANQISEGG